MADARSFGRPATADRDQHPPIAGAIEASGAPDAPVIVFLHGTRRTRAMWRAQLTGLADAFRVVAVDLPGHGALADVPFRLGDAADFVVRVIDEVAGGRAIVAGQSLGGYVAMDLAARRPERVAGLVLANATAEPRSVARRAPRTVGSYLLVAATDRIRARAGAAAGAAGIPAAAARASADHAGTLPRREPGPRAGMLREAFEGDAASTDGERAAGDGAAGDGVHHAAGDGVHFAAGDATATGSWLFKGGTRAIIASLGQAFVPRLAAYPGPTLLLNGADDELFRRGERAFLAVAAAGRLEVIPGAGHLVNEERPEEFNDAVRRFAREVYRPRPGRRPPR